jgi:hypothetical protein
MERTLDTDDKHSPQQSHDVPAGVRLDDVDRGWPITHEASECLARPLTDPSGSRSNKVPQKNQRMRGGLRAASGGPLRKGVQHIQRHLNDAVVIIAGPNRTVNIPPGIPNPES